MKKPMRSETAQDALLHEIKNSLQSLRLSEETLSKLLEKNRTAGSAKGIDPLRQSLREMEQWVDFLSLLDGNYSGRQETLDLDTLLDPLRPELEKTARRFEVNLHFQKGDGKGPLRCDAELLRRGLSYLIRQMIRRCDFPGDHVRIHFHCERPRFYEIIVEQIPRETGPRAQKDGVKLQGGLPGKGAWKLADLIMKKIAAFHGGKFAVKNSAGGGRRCSLRLPKES